MISTLALAKIEAYNPVTFLKTGIIIDCSKNLALSTLTFSQNRQVTTQTTNPAFANAEHILNKCDAASRWYQDSSGPMKLNFACGGSGPVMQMMHTGLLPDGQDPGPGSIGMHVLNMAARIVSYKSVDSPSDVFNMALSTSKAVTGPWANAIISLINSTALQDALLAFLSDHTTEIAQGQVTYTFTATSPRIVFHFRMSDATFSMKRNGNLPTPLVIKEIPVYLVIS